MTEIEEDEIKNFLRHCWEHVQPLEDRRNSHKCQGLAALKRFIKRRQYITRYINHLLPCVRWRVWACIWICCKTIVKWRDACLFKTIRKLSAAVLVSVRNSEQYQSKHLLQPVGFVYFGRPICVGWMMDKNMTPWSIGCLKKDIT